MSNQARGGETLPGGSPGPSSGSRCTEPEQQQLTLGTWNVGKLAGKEKDLVTDVERYKLDLVGLTSTHSLRSGAKTLDRGWTLFFSGVADRLHAGVGILINPRLRASWLEFTPVNKRVVSLRLRVMGGKILNVVCAYAPNIEGEYLAFLVILEGVLRRVPKGECVVLLGDFNAHVGNKADQWPNVIGINGPTLEDESGRHLLNFCNTARQRFCITNTKFAHKDDLKYTWYCEKPRQRSLIDFVIVPSFLWPYVCDTWVERDTKLSTDHCLVVSRIGEWGTRDEPAIPITTKPNTLPPVTTGSEEKQKKLRGQRKSKQ